jgi:hypothetical protein
MRLTRRQELELASAWIARLTEVERTEHFTMRERIADAMIPGMRVDKDSSKAVLRERYTRAGVAVIVAISKLLPWPRDGRERGFELLHDVVELTISAARKGEHLTDIEACRRLKHGKCRARYDSVRPGTLATKLSRQRKSYHKHSGRIAAELQVLKRARMLFGNFLPLRSRGPLVTLNTSLEM